MISNISSNALVMELASMFTCHGVIGIRRMTAAAMSRASTLKREPKTGQLDPASQGIRDG
jgi:hypothetical protein